jgi:hypothetical protein
MDFQNYAAHETSELVNRLVTGASDKVAGDLQALRQAFDMVTSALDAALASQTGPEYQDEVAALAGRLTAEAARQAAAASEQVRNEAQVTIDHLRAELQAGTTETAALAASLEQAQAQADGLAALLHAEKKLTDAARAEHEEAQRRTGAARVELEGALERARGDSDAVRGELQGVRELLESARAESARLSAQRDAEAAQSEKVTAALSTVTTELQEAKGHNRDLLARARSTADELGALKHANREHENARRTLQARLDASNDSATALQKRAEEAEREAERLRAEVQRAAEATAQTARALEESEARAPRLLAEQADTMRQHAGGFFSTSLDRLLAMHLTADKGATIDHALAAIVDALATQFPRVALFRVQSNHLEGVRQVGFDLHADISQVLIPRTLDSLVTQAVRSTRVEARSGKELTDTSGMQFAGTPDFGLALPIVIDGESMAVVYADDSGQADRSFAQSELRLKFAQLLQWQAVPLLTRLVAQAKVIAELDQYAALLVDEIEHTYEADLKAGGATSDSERRKNLRDNIEYARRMYGQRAAVEGPRAAPLFEQRLAATVEARGATPFGRDIVAAIGGSKRPVRAAKAEAS